MEYTVSERTITVRTTEPGEQLTRETVQALTGRTEAWQTVERLALAAPETTPEQPSKIDTSFDPLEDITYADVPHDVLAEEDRAERNQQWFAAWDAQANLAN
jgi:hypothetical protein